MANETSMFSYIDATIEQLNGIKSSLDAQFLQLQGATQEYVDKVIVNEINPNINSLLAKIRASVISSGQAMYAQYQKLTQLIAPVAEANPTDLSKVIDFCLAVKDFLIAAYETLTNFLIELTQKLVELNLAIASLVAYVPPITGISFDKLNIQMEPIQLSDITGG